MLLGSFATSGSSQSQGLSWSQNRPIALESKEKGSKGEEVQWLHMCSRPSRAGLELISPLLIDFSFSLPALEHCHVSFLQALKIAACRTK